MSEKPPIEIEVEIEQVPEDRVVPHGSDVRRACTLALSGERQRLFAPAVQPQMRGRRPSGVEFTPSQPVHPAMKPQPLIEEPADLPMVTKRAAKAVAEEITGLPISVHERNNRCQIEVRFPHQSLEFEAYDWFSALGALKHYLDSRNRKRPT